MTKQELINTLLAKDAVLGIAKEFPVEILPDGVLRYVYNLKIATSSDGINYKNISFYVENEGEANELAYWENSEPMPVNNEVSFRTKVYQKIEQAVSSGTIKGAIVDKLDDASKVAQATVFKADPNSGNKVVVSYFMVRDNAGTIELAEISGGLV